VIAVYTMLQDVGHALGALVAGAPGLARRSNRAGWCPARIAPSCSAAPRAARSRVALYVRLGPAIEQARADRPRLTAPSARSSRDLGAVRARQAWAEAFSPPRCLVLFFERFGTSEATIAALFFAARADECGLAPRGRVARQAVGLVNTMVWTHMPSSLLLVTVAFAPSLPVAAVLFCSAKGSSRWTYRPAVVRPAVVRTGGANAGVRDHEPRAARRRGPWPRRFAGFLMTERRLYLRWSSAQ